jgi:hypothetical protein
MNHNRRILNSKNRVNSAKNEKMSVTSWGGFFAVSSLKGVYGCVCQNHLVPVAPLQLPMDGQLPVSVMHWLEATF